MSRKKKADPSLWGLAVLCLLRERPMHPYEMLQILRERHKEELLALKPGSIYHSIGRLERGGLIESIETSRQGSRPARTIYRITPAGEEAALDWLRELIRKPVLESSDFMTALSHILHLTPRDAGQVLAERIGHLEASINELNALLGRLRPTIGRLPLIEVEYLRAMRLSELEWVRELVEELDRGDLSWDGGKLSEKLGTGGS